MLEHQFVTLESGLEVLTIPMPAMASVTVLVLGNTGSRFETASEQGIAHFLEHMVFKGTQAYPSAQDLATAVDAIGAQSNAFTSKEYTGYYVKAASRHLEKALDVLSDMLLRPLMKAEDIEREKGVIIEEINMYADTPMQDIDNVFEQLLFTPDQLGHDVIGTKDTVSSLGRDNFMHLLEQWYGLANLTLVVAGDERVVAGDTFLPLVNQYFSQKKPTGNRQQHRHDLTKYLQSNAVNTGKLSVRTKATEQAHLMMGWPSMPRHDQRRYAQAVLAVALGGNMSSRLFSEVREKRGLCYYVHAAADYFHDAGVFATGAGVDPKRVHEAVQVIKDECLAVGSGERGITAIELERAKDYITGTMTLSLEDSRSVAQYFGLKQVLMRQIEPPSEMLRNIRAVTLEQVQQLAHDTLTQDQLRLALIGPFEQTEFEQYV